MVERLSLAGSLPMFLWLVVGLLVVLVAVVFGAQPLARWMNRRGAERAMRLFRQRREVLEAQFLDLASRLGKPRGVRWKQCDWQSDVTFARDRESGLLTAFVGVNVSFEAIEGGDMEEVEHVGLLRDGAAVFHYQAGQWGTGGRVLFNMNPHDAVARFEHQYEPIAG